VTMIDEGVLIEALRDAAEAIEIPEGATERILAASRTTTPKARMFRPRAVIPRRGRGRMILVAAAVILVVGGVALSLLPTKLSPSRSITAGPSSAGSTVHGSASPGSAAPAPSIAGTGTGTIAGSSGIGGTAGTAQPPNASGSGAAGPTSVPPLPPGSVGQSPKVDANGSVNLTIGDGKLESVLAKLTGLAASDGGFVANTQAQIAAGGPGTSSSGTVILRVPQPSFGTMLSQVQQLGHATSVTTTSTDVTGQYVDLQARITALQASRQQYLTIMAHTTSIGDILAVQSQLDALQSQIEQLQGQLAVLDNETTYGTLTVSLTEAGQRSILPVQPSTGLGKAWHDGISGFVSGFEWLIRIAGPTLFVLLCLAAVLVLGRWAWRATRRRML
jgi:hypothetical protein